MSLIHVVILVAIGLGLLTLGFFMKPSEDD